MAYINIAFDVTYFKNRLDDWIEHMEHSLHLVGSIRVSWCLEEVSIGCGMGLTRGT